MSSLQCSCGYLIIDRTDSIPYKGYFYADNALKKKGELEEKAIEMMKNLYEAAQNGVLVQFIYDVFLPLYGAFSEQENERYQEAEQFAAQGIPQLCYQIMNEFDSKFIAQYVRIMYECPNCGRLYVEKQGKYYGYTPDEDIRGLLSIKPFEAPPKRMKKIF